MTLAQIQENKNKQNTELQSHTVTKAHTVTEREQKCKLRISVATQSFTRGTMKEGVVAVEVGPEGERLVARSFA